MGKTVRSIKGKNYSDGQAPLTTRKNNKTKINSRLADMDFIDGLREHNEKYLK